MLKKRLDKKFFSTEFSDIFLLRIIVAMASPASSAALVLLVLALLCGVGDGSRREGRREQKQQQSIDSEVNRARRRC